MGGRGGRPAEPRTSPALLERRRLAFLFGDYLLAGALLLPRGVRLSDFLSQAKPFQTLKEAGLYLLAPDRPLVDLDPPGAVPLPHREPEARRGGGGGPRGGPGPQAHPIWLRASRILSACSRFSLSRASSASTTSLGAFSRKPGEASFLWLRSARAKSSLSRFS